MKNLIVFGDSFNSLNMKVRGKDFSGTHWSEILSKRHNLNLISLARSGCSTRYVVFQILHALSYTDSIIIGSHASSFTRIELLTKDGNSDRCNIKLDSFENFDIDDTDTPFMKSINLFTLGNDSSIPDNVKNVLLTKIPAGMNYHIDKWGMFYALHELKKNAANFLYMPNLLFPDFDLFDDNDLLDQFGKEHILDEFSFEPYYVDRDSNPDFIDPGYHTKPESQIEIANIIEARLIKQGLL
jgi:hypothetical protein